MFTVDDLTLKRNYRTVFSNIGFTLFPGACLNIIGNNGSGKSSLLKTLAGIYKTEPGTIYFDDEDVVNNFDEYKKQIIYIGHKNGLKPQLSVVENLNFWANIAGFNLALNAAIHTLGLNNYVDTEIYKLSIGWQKRVSLARLLLSNAKIWLLDEPFANVDSVGHETLKNMINARVNQNGIVITTSHEPLTLKPCITIDLQDYGGDAN